MQQQEFLREAMKELGLTRKGFAERLGCAQRTLDKWLLPTESKDHNTMNETIWVLIREIREHEKLKTRHEKLVKEIGKNIA
jgi:DNA-binding transcriptional regulator YiaG